MCGIYVMVCSNCDKAKVTEEFENSDIKKLIDRRGNNNQGLHIIDIVETGNVLLLYGSVLHIRGKARADQPAVDENGNILVFNGEILGGQYIDELDELSDTRLLLNKLKFCTTDREVGECLSRIEGPFAFVYWQSSSKKLWAGRDILGRRSLCWQTSETGDGYTISSVADSTTASEWTELPANGFYCHDFTAQVSVKMPVLRCTWDTTVSGRRSEPAHTHPEILERIKLSVNCDHSGKLDLDSSETGSDAIDSFINVLNESVRKRATLHNFKCKFCVTTLKECRHCSVAVLFSGGIDSTVIALLLDNHLSSDIPVDLLNVAFDPNAPDRLTAIKAHEELEKVRPSRTWRLVQIDSCLEEVVEAREKFIQKLIYPLETVLDDSIGCSLWFAARGIGKLDGQDYESSARILLHGLGADEQLAGYSRHRRIFFTSGIDVLLDELSSELDRLHCRNLGRDDRIASDHSKEIRFPFLDEQVVSFLNGLPASVKFNLNEPRGTGEKKLLRQVAWKLGLEGTSTNEKRAIQFGSRIAKLENRKEKGDMKCTRLKIKS
ncbi:Asparagine synthetase domain-containing protein 1 [Halotydeus destructor]|nr:Asparagine synthetase domain-containing protein 1 [Halotydeus destructor]